MTESIVATYWLTIIICSLGIFLGLGVLLGWVAIIVGITACKKLWRDR